MRGIVTAIVYNKKDALCFLKDAPIVDRVYPMTPDAYVELIDHTKAELLKTEQHYTDYCHRKVIAKVRRAEREVKPLIESHNGLSLAGKELFFSLFHVLASSCYYLYYSINKLGPWMIYDGANWIYTEDLSEAYKLFSNNVFKSHYPTYFDHALKTNNQLSAIAMIANYFVVKQIIKNNKCVWTTGVEYGLKELNNLITKADSGIVIVFIRPVSLKTLVRSVKDVLFSFIPFCEIKTVGLSTIPSNKTSNDLSCIFNELTDVPFISIVPLLHEYMKKSIEYIDSNEKSVYKVFSDTSPKVLISHHLKFKESLLLGAAAKKYGVPSVLISHGSHPVSLDKTSEYELNANARNMLVSCLADETVAQTPFALDYIKKNQPTAKLRKSLPIMWGYRKLSKINQKKNKRVILHAGTAKIFGIRPWIYETPSEYVIGLQKLVSAVNKMENVLLIIRHRISQECSLNNLKKLLSLGNNCIIKTDGSFLNNLAEADLLVSFSSTTIEESLYARTPVALFGGSDRYRHLPGTAELPTTGHRNAVYHLNKINMVEMLDSILNLHESQPLTDIELRDYIWQESTPNRDDFVRDIVKLSSNNLDYTNKYTNNL